MEAVEVFSLVAGVVGGEAEVVWGLGGERGEGIDGDGEEGGMLVIVGYEDIVQGWEGLVGVCGGAMGGTHGHRRRLGLASRPSWRPRRALVAERHSRRGRGRSLCQSDGAAALR